MRRPAIQTIHYLERREQRGFLRDELIATIVPRPVLVVEPTMDRTTTPADVRQAVARARQAYSLYFASDKLTLHEPVDYTRLTAATQDGAVRWMNQIHAPTPVASTAK